MPQSIKFAGPVWRVHGGLARSLNFIIAIAAFGPVALMMLLGLLNMMLGHDLLAIAAAAWAAAWLFGIPALFLAATVAGRPWQLRASAVELSSMGISIHRGANTRLMRRAQIVGALVLASSAEADLELTFEGGDLLVLRIPSASAGEAAIDALDLRATERRITVSLDGTADAMKPVGVGLIAGVVGAILLTCALAPFGALSWTHRWLPYALGTVFVVTALIVWRAFDAKRVVVGTDGVHIQGGLRAHFVPRSAVHSVTTTARGNVVLTRKNAPPIELRCGARAAALAARIDEALRVGPDDGGRIAAAQLLERRGRSLSEWRAALRLLSGATDDYRHVTLTGDALLAVVRDADAPLERRIGAAMALAVGADDEARKRLRFATEGLASEHVRLLMERAAGDEVDEESIEHALSEVLRQQSSRVDG